MSLTNKASVRFWRQCAIKAWFAVIASFLPDMSYRSGDIDHSTAHRSSRQLFRRFEPCLTRRSTSANCEHTMKILELLALFCSVIGFTCRKFPDTSRHYVKNSGLASLIGQKAYEESKLDSSNRNTAASDFDRQCAPSADPGPCKGFFPKWWYNVVSGKCEEFVYGGCQGNDNRYDTQEECESTCAAEPMHNFACLMERDRGPCRASITRYYFDTRTGTCEEFIYGGCEGNLNNFETVEECKASCAPQTVYEAKCLARPETGPCRGHMILWAYDVNMDRCKTFAYGGCDGTDNKYPTEQACVASCIRPRTELVEEYIMASRQLAESYNTTEVEGIFSIPELQSEAERSNPVCNLPMKRGPCHAYLPRYYYYKPSKTCDLFYYGGCRGNANNFADLEECLRVCKPLRPGPGVEMNYVSEPKPTNPVCYEPKKVGPCKAYVPCYFYNTTTKYCERFIYGGCKGNRNNFPEIEECLQTCKVGYQNVTERFLQLSTPLKNDTCYLPMKAGPCYGYFPRYYYNATTNTCKQFIYGGCQGNANNFPTLQKCQSVCTNSSYLEELTRSRLITKLVTLDPVCELPKKIGPCHALVPRYYYNTTIDTCEVFIYGGCKGNANNFETLTQCETRCGGNLTVEDDSWKKHITKPVAVAEYIRSNPVLPRSLVRLNPVCNEPKQPGPCAGYFPRFYFDNVTKTCEPFVYGGCQANGNNFYTLEECNNTCWASLHHHPLVITSAVEVPFWPLSTPEECTYPVEAGPCEAYMPRFFYNILTKTCEQFIYGGCGGNANNFRTYGACQNKCTKFLGVIPRA